MAGLFKRLAQAAETQASRETRGAIRARGGGWAQAKRTAAGREVGPLALLDNGDITMFQGFAAGGYEIAPVSGAHAYVAAAGRGAGLFVGAVVPVGPIGVGTGGNLGRSEVHVVVEHADGRLPWRAQFRGGDAKKAIKLVDLINQAAAQSQRA